MTERAALQGIGDAYDVVVIGSGWAGLTGAHCLAKAGNRVLLLEQHQQIGGLATWFKRKGGHIFDVSLHGFPVGMIKSCKRYWGAEIAEDIVPLRDMRFHNPQFQLQTTYERDDFCRLLVEQFRLTETQVRDFFAHVENQEFFQQSHLSTAQLIESFFPGRGDIKRLLLEPIAYANGSSEDDPALAYSIVFSNFMKKGIYTFRGGTDRLMNKLARILQEEGVEIRRRVKVERILTKREGDAVRATGVLCEGGKVIHCRAVLSNSNLKHTIGALVPAEDFPDPSFVQSANQVRLNSSSCQVYLGIRKGGSIPHSGDLLFHSDSPVFSSDELKSRETGSRTFSFYYPESRPDAREPRYTIVASTNARWEDWATLDPDAYRQAKEALIARTLEVLERFLPGVREEISHIEAATPRTIHHYTGHLMGASFGTKFEGLAVSQALPDQVRGLYHAGSAGIIMSGWLGTLNYGVMTAHRMEQFLGNEGSVLH
jgi:all-trans-retinol 13,14-reductase